MNRDDLMKTIQDLGVTAMELYDELQRTPPDAAIPRMGKAPALSRLLSVYQRDLRLKLDSMKKQTSAAVKLSKETKEQE